MARGPSTFRQADVTRVMKGAIAAGADIGQLRVEIDKDGKIILVTGAGATPEPETDFDRWKKKSHARSA